MILNDNNEHAHAPFRACERLRRNERRRETSTNISCAQQLLPDRSPAPFVKKTKHRTDREVNSPQVIQLPHRPRNTSVQGGPVFVGTTGGRCSARERTMAAGGRESRRKTGFEAGTNLITLDMRQVSESYSQPQEAHHTAAGVTPAHSIEGQSKSAAIIPRK